MNKFPEEIVRKIYQYLNPIAKPFVLDKRFWCYYCGEYIPEDSVCLELPESPKTMSTLHQRLNYNKIVKDKKLYCFDCFNSR